MSDSDPVPDIRSDPVEAPHGPLTIEHDHRPPPAGHDAEPPPSAAAAPRRGGTPLPLTLLLVAALGGAIWFVWTHPQGGEASAGAPGQAIEAAKAELAGQIQALSGRIDALEKAPAAAAGADAQAALGKRLDDMSAALSALTAKQDALETALQKLPDAEAQKAPPASQAAPDQAQAADVAALTAQIQATDSRIDQSAQQQKGALAALAQRLDHLESAVSQAEAASQDQSRDQTALDSLRARIGRLEQGAGQDKGAAQDAALAIRLEAAQAALEAGQPLGELPNAPQALARFATTPPPTEASLRTAFPQVAEAARAASRPDTGRQSFFQRALARVQQTVTVRRGDHVIIGDPAAGVLAQAQADVGNGDLKGAVAALKGLNGPAAAAVAGWVADVQALLDARAALAALAAHG
jgi:hypothetical protein